MQNLVKSLLDKFLWPIVVGVVVVVVGLWLEHRTGIFRQTLIASVPAGITETPTQRVAESRTPTPRVLKLSDYGRLLYENTFDGNTEAWSLGDSSAIRGGELIIPEGSFAYPNSDTQFSDFIFETSFRHVQPAGNSESNFFLRFQVPPCSNWNCSIQIWASGDWKTVGSRIFTEKQVLRLLLDTPAPRLDQTRGNKLTVITKGNEYEIFVDDVFVQSFTDSTYQSGKFLLASPAGTTAIDYIRIYALP